MNAPPTQFGHMSGTGSVSNLSAPDSTSPADADSTSMRWAALVEAGKVVAGLAGTCADQLANNDCDFAALMRDCPQWQRELAENGVADLAAVMEPGLAALLAINARSSDPRAAALALWQEYVDARSAILSLVGQGNSAGSGTVPRAKP